TWTSAHVDRYLIDTGQYVQDVRRNVERHPRLATDTRHERVALVQNAHAAVADLLWRPGGAGERDHHDDPVEVSPTTWSTAAPGTSPGTSLGSPPADPPAGSPPLPPAAGAPGDPAGSSTGRPTDTARRARSVVAMRPSWRASGH